MRFRFPVANAGAEDQVGVGAGLDRCAVLMAVELTKVFLVDRRNGLLEQIGKPFTLHAGSLPCARASQLLL